MNLKTAKSILVSINVIALVYHALIVTRVVDFVNVWGGQLQTVVQMYTFETISIAIQMLLLWFILSFKIEKGVGNRFYIYLFFSLALLMLLNTIGNVFAKTDFERFIFAPLTLVASYCYFVYYSALRTTRNQMK
ncbi:MAG: hypothetical protein ACOYT9_03605 [Patescibacteria group bacterium]